VALRLLVGAALAALISWWARRNGHLTGGGAVAALLVGTCAVAAGWFWAAALLTFFTTSVAWTRAGAEGKRARTEGMTGRTGARDPVQVFANGGVFAVAALALAFSGGADTSAGVLPAIALGALAAATADTWATEVGLLARGLPRSILTGRPVDPGTSGGITMAGTAAGCGGAALIGGGAAVAGHGALAASAAFAGGVAGMLIDSVLGASLQTRRWCDACGAATERVTHTCGAPTRRVGGVSWLNNDGVNALATVAGAATSLAVAAL